MQSKSTWMFALAAVALMLSTAVPARDLTVVSWGGAYQDAQKKVYFEPFKKAIDNLGDVVAYLDKPEFAKFWDEDAKRVEAAVQAIGKV